jgi:acetate kinase
MPNRHRYGLRQESNSRLLGFAPPVGYRLENVATPPIAVLNAGSSSLKFSFFEGERLEFRGLVDRIGLSDPPHAFVTSGTGRTWIDEELGARTHAEVLDWLFRRLSSDFPGFHPAAVGHRVVHGGDRFTVPVRVTPEILSALDDLIPLAPLHQPHNLGPIRLLLQRQPSLPQIACFDTAFHATQEPLDRRFALPREYAERGIKRYGFHGLSYEYVASRLRDLDPKRSAGRVIVCHLGNGSSLCAMKGGRSVATTMSFTALDGLPMGTRSGSIDPGVLLHLMERERLDAAKLKDLLYHRSGLLGLSGVSSDMRELLADPSPAAAEAVEYFCRKVGEAIGGLAARLGGLDILVFTAGIGEHAAPVRARVAELSAWLGVRLDARANNAGRTELHARESAVALYVIPTDEERMIARHAARSV